MLSKAERFIRRVNKYGWDVTESGCWEWRGTRKTDGYGVFHYDHKSLGAHRVAYEVWVGPIPKGLLIRHKCDNRPCINPDHLETGTVADNNRDMNERGRYRHGHKYVGETHVNSKLTNQDVLDIRREYKNGVLTQAMLAEAYGVARSYVCRVLSNKKRSSDPLPDDGTFDSLVAQARSNRASLTI